MRVPRLGYQRPALGAGVDDIAVFEVDWGGRETRDLVHLLAELRPGNQAWSNSPYVYFAPRQAERPADAGSRGPER